MKRRTFINHSTLLGASAILPLPFKQAIQPSAKSMGVALVGLGRYATGQLGPALLESQNCHLAGIVTGTKAKEGIWKEKYGIKDSNIYNYDNYDSIVDNEDIDIIYVVLPNSMHKEYVIRAAQAKKHVLCEKPMGLNAKECEEMIQACEDNGVKLGVGYRCQYTPHHLKVMELARDTATYGPVKFVQSDFAFPIGDPTQWRLKKDMAGGGALYDIGIYCIQAARYSVGEEPLAVSAHEYKTDPVKFAEVDETMTFAMKFPSGAISNSMTSYIGQCNRLLVSTPKLKFGLEPAYGYGQLKGFIGSDEMMVDNINQQAAQMDAFVNDIEMDRKSKTSGEEGLRDAKVIDAIVKSAAMDGRWIEIE